MSGYKVSQELFRNAVINIKSNFTVLSDWTVEYVEDRKYLNQCVLSTDLKKAVIYPMRDEDILNLYKYIRHELLHVAIEASKESKLHNEQFVLDLEAYIDGVKQKDLLHDKNLQDLRIFKG